MTYDLSEFKTPVFPNINDKPVEPTASKAGNGADLIYRLNGLVDKLESTLNSLNVVLPNIDWKITTPNSSDIKQINVFHSNISERLLYSQHALSLQPNDLIQTFLAPDDFIPGDIINISDLITQNGCGYYIFLIAKDDDTNKPWSWTILNSTPIPRGCARTTDNFLQVDTSSLTPGVSTIQVTSKLLQVVQPVGNVNIILKDEELTFG